MSHQNDANYIIEFYALGNSVKATAIDPGSGVEATVTGPIATPREYLISQAVKKLERKLKKLAGESESDILA